jgi:pentatricopeptide repeat protein
MQTKRQMTSSSISTVEKGNEKDTAPDLMNTKKIDPSSISSQKVYENARQLFRGDAAPNTETYNIAMSSFADCGYARAAEDLLNEMIESESKVVQPNVVSYNTAIDGWSRSQEHGAADRAERILNMMEKVDEGRDLAPISSSFIGVISAYCKSGAPGSGDQAQNILERFERSGLQVESFVYNTVLDCHAKSGRKDSIDKVEALLERMVTLDVANRYDLIFGRMLSMTLIRILISNICSKYFIQYSHKCICKIQ